MQFGSGDLLKEAYKYSGMKQILKLITLTILTFTISTSLQAVPVVVSTNSGTPIVTVTTVPVDVISTDAVGFVTDTLYNNLVTTTIPTTVTTYNNGSVVTTNGTPVVTTNYGTVPVQIVTTGNVVSTSTAPRTVSVTGNTSTVVTVYNDVVTATTPTTWTTVNGSTSIVTGNAVTVTTATTTPYSVATTANVVTTSTSPRTVTVTGNGTTVATNYLDTVTTTTPTTTTSVAGVVAVTTGNAIITTTANATPSTIATTTNVPAVVTANGTPIITLANSFAPVTTTNGAATIVTTNLNVLTTTTTPIATTTVLTPTTVVTDNAGNVLSTSYGAPTSNSNVSFAVATANSSSLYSVATTTNAVTSVTKNGTPVVGNVYTYSTTNSTDANNNPVAKTYKLTTTTTTTPVDTATTTTPVTVTKDGNGYIVSTYYGAPVTTDNVVNNAVVTTANALYSTATTTQNVKVQNVYGNPTTTWVNVNGTPTISTAYSQAKAKSVDKKVLNVAKTTTVTTVTPVTTTATTVTPVTTVTTTTPVITTVFTDNSTPTAIAYGAPTVTNNTSVDTAKIISNSTATAVTNSVANFGTRIDQVSFLQDQNKRLNKQLDSNSLDRNKDVEVAEVYNATSYLIADYGRTNVADTYTFTNQRYGFGFEEFIGANNLVGIQYDYITGDLKSDTNEASGSLTKHHIGLFNLVKFSDLIVKSDVGYAYDKYTNAHTLNALGYSNTGTAHGNDYWANVRVYSPKAAGFRAYVNGRYEGDKLTGFTEAGSDYTAQTFTSTSTSKFTAAGGLRFDAYVGECYRVIAEGGYNSDKLIDYSAGLSVEPNKLINITLTASQQRYAQPIINGQAVNSKLSLQGDVKF